MWVILTKRNERGWAISGRSSPFFKWSAENCGQKDTEQLDDLAGIAAIVVNPFKQDREAQRTRIGEEIKKLPKEGCRIWVHLADSNPLEVTSPQIAQHLQRYGLKDYEQQALPYTFEGQKPAWDIDVEEIKKKFRNNEPFRFQKKLEDAWREGYQHTHHNLAREQLLQDLFPMYIDMCGLLREPTNEAYLVEAAQAMKSFAAEHQGYSQVLEKHLEKELITEFSLLWKALATDDIESRLRDPDFCERFKVWFESFSDIIDMSSK